MNVRTGWSPTDRISTPHGPQTLAWSIGVDGDVPCLVVTDYADAAVVYVTCDDCQYEGIYTTTHPCCEKSIRCIVVPLPAEAGNE